MGNPLVIAQMLAMLISEIRGRKAEKTANIITELLQDMEVIEEVRLLFDQAIANKTGMTLTLEQIEGLEEVFDDADTLLKKLKLKK